MSIALAADERNFIVSKTDNPIDGVENMTTQGVINTALAHGLRMGPGDIETSTQEWRWAVLPEGEDTGRLVRWRHADGESSHFVVTPGNDGAYRTLTTGPIIPFNPHLTGRARRISNRVALFSGHNPGVWMSADSSNAGHRIRLAGFNGRDVDGVWVIARPGTPVGGFLRQDRGVPDQEQSEPGETLTHEQWQQKWDALWEALGQEAGRRNWCSEYDEFARENGGPERKSEWQVTARVTGIVWDAAVGQRVEEVVRGLRSSSVMQNGLAATVSLTFVMESENRPQPAEVGQYLIESSAFSEQFQIDSVVIVSAYPSAAYPGTATVTPF